VTRLGLLRDSHRQRQRHWRSFEAGTCDYAKPWKEQQHPVVAGHSTLGPGHGKIVRGLTSVPKQIVACVQNCVWLQDVRCGVNPDSLAIIVRLAVLELSKPHHRVFRITRHGHVEVRNAVVIVNIVKCCVNIKLDDFRGITIGWRDAASERQAQR
jgi:hypothetical protein